MSDLALHPSTEERIAAFIAHPSHAILLIGPRGVGKGSVAQLLASQILRVSVDQVANQPYVRYISSGKEQSISIDVIRELDHFLALKVPGGAGRVVVIEDAHTMTTEAQNALLKTLEEPPLQTTIILTAAGEQSLLPTIRSRVAALTVGHPTADVLRTYFNRSGFDDLAIQKSLLMSGGLPGLMAALLTNATDHQLTQAAATAREIIQKPTFERLSMVDGLAKQKPYALDVLAMLGQMAHVALAGPKPAPIWQRALQQSYHATELLLGSAQPKLVLTDLMLSL